MAMVHMIVFSMPLIDFISLGKRLHVAKCKPFFIKGINYIPHV